MQATQPKITLLYGGISLRKVFLAITALLFCSVLLSYFFQEIVFQNHCFTKLGIILTGNLVFWSAGMPLIRAFANKNAGSKYFLPASIGMGAGLLFINQLFIQNAIYLIFLYGFGCLEGVSNSCYMLFENNILTSGLIYCILALVTYHSAVSKKQPVTEDPLIVPETLATELPVYKSYITIKTNGSRFQVKVQDISYIEAQKNTILIFAGGRKHVLYQSMVSVEKELDPENFVKIHRAFVVNRSFIHSCTGIANGNVLVKLHCGAELVMTRHYKTQVSY